MNDKPIFVTEPLIPPFDEYTRLLREIWDNKIFTHNGPLVKRFEDEISKKLKIKNFITTTNGTTALQIAIKSLGLKGEVITTPFSWIATISAIKCEGCSPVFCDIDPGTFNIDPHKIEKYISDKTVAIVPVHTFGNPCDINEIELIAKKHNLKVIYDAAHSIGSTFKNKSILEYGDISATSLHCTKLINTAEGGGCITTDIEIYEKIKRIRFFGHDENRNIVEDGLNGKMTEIHAALGLANLKYYEEVLQDRKEKYKYYKKQLTISDQFSFQVTKHGEQNYSYFPIIFKSENNLLKAEKSLKKNNIYPRRYFYPSLNTFEKTVKSVNMPISFDISKRILCLPLYWRLNFQNIDKIIKILLDEKYN